MTGPDPLEHGWWLVSRSAGILALLCVTISVGVGLSMAGRVSGNPRLARRLMALHEQTALAGLVAIAVHAIALLGDRFLDPGVAGVLVPFAIDHEPLWTGLGTVGGWLAVILGLSYYARERIGPARWRSVHRATLLVYVLSVAHTVGAGTDGGEPWMLALLAVTGAPVVFLFVLRVLPAPAPAPRDAPRRFRVAEITPESADVTSFALEPVDGRPLAPFAPGQFVAVHVDGAVRSYSLSAGPDPRRHRISVRRDGAVSRRLHDATSIGDTLEVGEPAGVFTLPSDEHRAVVLISAGVGATPVLAMLHVLARQGAERPVWWIHGARCGPEHAFREEVRELVGNLRDGRLHVAYSRPEPRDDPGDHHHATGRLTADAVLALGVPRDAAFRLCGPQEFVADISAGLREHGARDVTSEAFGGRAAPAPAPSVAFSRSGVDATWDPSHGTLLALAEAHAVPAASGCRVGACQACRVPVLSGRVQHDPARPVDGSALLCCARPDGDVVLDV